MKKFRLLLLDANVVIVLCKLDLWDLVLEKCEILLARTVFESEAVFYEDEEEEKVYLNLEEDYKQGKLQVVDVPIAQVAAFLAPFKPLYLGELDPGEAESLAYLVNATEQHFFCSADKIVYRVLGALNREDQGLSLERLLQQIGLTAGKLGQEFSETYRLRWTRQGQQEAFLGQALR
jgi:hypothetical protein